MSIGLLGKKVGMTQLFTEQGDAIPVTIVKAGPCTVLQLKTDATDGYEAVQIGFMDKAERLARRSELGHVKSLDSKRQKSLAENGAAKVAKAETAPKRFVREFRIPVEGFEVGQNLDVNVFGEVFAVDVSSKSKGRGYSGVIKRHNFGGQRATHGVKKCHRHLGSTGCSAYPSRTIKGKKMPGQYGSKNCTVRNQKIVVVDPENNLLVIRGGIPGPNGSMVVVRPTNKLPAPKSNKWRIA